MFQPQEQLRVRERNSNASNFSQTDVFGSFRILHATSPLHEINKHFVCDPDDDKFIKSVASSMTGGSRAALSELVNHAE